MSDIYDVDFDLQADNLNNPRFRWENITAWLNILLKPLQWVHDNFFTQFRFGTSYAAWSNVTAYVIGNRVSYGRASYECYVANTGKLPTDSNFWVLVCADNIGIEERLKYNAQGLLLEYILNRRFSPTTITPPFGAPYNNIYIVTNQSLPPILYSSSNDRTSGYTFPRSATRFFYCPLGNPVGGIWAMTNFTIYVPTAILTAIDADLVSAKNTVIAETVKYSIAGMTFNVIGY